MTKLLMEYQKCGKSKLKVHFQLLSTVFLILLEVQSHTVPHWKSLSYGKDESRELSCGFTSSICLDIMKSDNFLHKQEFVDSLSQTTVHAENYKLSIVQKSYNFKGETNLLRASIRGIISPFWLNTFQTYVSNYENISLSNVRVFVRNINEFSIKIRKIVN